MPADYNIPMTDAQITEALQLMVERVSEGWAQETFDGSPVGSGSPYYHKSSKWWATQAADAAARAEAAVPAGTAGAVFFDRAQTLTDAQAMQARANIVAGGSNPNLLDNPWFTVNQRSFTSTSSNNTYTVDRWIAQNMRTSGVCSVSDNIITLDATNAVGGGLTFAQAVDIDEMAGRTVTLSVMLADGNVYSKSVVLPARGTSQTTVISEYIGSTTNIMRLYVNGSTSNTPYNVQLIVPLGNILSIKAVKLELGPVSTLANDMPPNYAEELAKCQYYFERINAISNMELGVGIGTSSILYLNYNAKPKRAYPTLTLTGTVKTARSAVENTATSIAQQWFDVNTGLMHLGVNVTATAGTPYRVILMADSHIDLSADL